MAMANHHLHAASSDSSPPPIIRVSFNQDNSGFSVVTKDGFRIFDARTGKLCCHRSIGAFSIVEMLYNTNLLAIVGAGDQPSWSPRRLHIYNSLTGKTLRELNFLTTILAVRLNKKRLVVILQDKTFIYDSNSLMILDTIDTVPNAKGLCAFSPNSEGCYLALPASKTKGSVLIYNTMELYSLCQIDAHHNPLVAITFSSSGLYMATASEQGTLIRVHLVSQATKSYSFRRGTYTSTIYSLSFGPSVELPDILLATSSSGSVHVFFLRPVINQQRSSSFLGSIFSGSISNALESANHHVFHGAAPPGVKSYSLVHVMKRYSKDKISTAAAFCSSILIVDLSGHLRECSFSLNKMNESSWNLERDVNLLAAEEDNS